MIRNIKIHNILDISEISKSMEPNNVKNLWTYLFKCFLWFLKVWWVQENQGVMTIVVAPKDASTHYEIP
jgi:hypothetical protein